MTLTHPLRSLLSALVLISSLGTHVAGVPRDAVLDSMDLRQDGDRAEDLLPSASLSISGAAAGDGTFTMCLKGAVRPDQAYAGTDCWGWEDTTDHIEYAIMGVANGIAFVNTNTMGVVDIVPGPTLNCGGVRWRDIKTYKNYCYAVSECSGTNQGMMIMDMSFLPDSVKFIKSFTTATDVISHNLYIDTTKGYAYLVKANYTGIRIVNLANPTNPVEAGLIPTGDCHDVFTRNDTAYVAEGTQGSFSIWNVANKSTPVLLARVHIPSFGYVHNIWPTKDGAIAGTTEETSNKTIKFWDISNLSNITLLGTYLAPSRLAHNVHMERGKAFISHYESGVAVVDLTSPTTPTEIARYDTYTAGESANFNGCWGVFPHTRSGKVYGSNMDGRLFVFLTRSDVLSDTAVVSDSYGDPGEQIAVDISVRNDQPLQELVLPVAFSGPLNLIFDSVSTQGLRTSYFEDQGFLGYDPDNGRIAYRLISSTNNTSPQLAPGNGPVLRVFFTIPANASGSSNPVTLSPYIGPSTYYPTLTSECFTFQASVVNGSVNLGTPACCIDQRGNVNGSANDLVDLNDLSWLIAYLTGSSSFITLPCSEEANVNGAGVIDLTDLSMLIAYLTSPAGTVTLPACTLVHPRER